MNDNDQSPQTDNSSHFDYEVIDFEDSLRRLGGNHGLLKEFAAIFMEDTPELNRKIQLAIKHSDGKTLRDAAHSIKGLISNFGALTCVEKARNLEVAGHEKDFENAQDQYNQYIDQYERLKTELERYLATSNDGAPK